MLMKKALAVILTVITVFSLFGCSSKDYNQRKAEFEKDGITLTLTEAFKETDLYPTMAHMAYTSGAATVAVFKETRGVIDKTSAKEYAERWCASNVKFSPEPIKEENGVISTVYKAGYMDAEAVFYTTFFASDSSYWIVQFFCAAEVYDEYAPYFARWARKVKIA